MKRLLTIGVLCVTVVAAFVMSVAFVVALVTARSMYTQTLDVPTEQVALVLGASISSDGTLSPVLMERADAAASLYEAHKVSKILVSGDNSSLAHNEVYPVGKYLTAKGVPVADIFLDYAGFDTYSSMYRAKNIFGVTSMVVASQRFHLPRALFIAHALGVPAVGLDAAAPQEFYSANALREIPATVKALMDILTHRTPRYLGPTFFVTGDGSATWVGSTTPANNQMIYFNL